jgi:hypothetical protein
MTTREALHSLVDRLPESGFTAAERFLTDLQIADRRKREQGTATAVERLDQIRAQIMHGRVFEDDSTEILRRARTERSAL